VNADVTKPYSGSFVGKSHHFAVRVYIEDTDLGGVVYHANYLRFLERARSDALRAMGIQQRASLESGLGVFAVAEMRIKYCRPARLEDDLLVVSDIVGVHGACCVLTQKIVRGSDLMVEATVTLAFINPQGRPKRQPPEWVQKFRAVAQPTSP
jgi:acyl-CoA thioester hydrolase